MKNYYFLRSAFVAAFMLLFALGCKESESGNSGPSITEFIIQKEVLYDRMTITVTPPDDAPQFFMRPFSQRSLPADLTDDALQAFIITESDFGATLYSGEREINFGGLIGGSKYELIYFGYDPVNRVATTPLIRENFSTPEGPQNYEISYENLTAFSVDVEVVPNDNEPFYAWIQPKAIYEKNGGDNYGIIVGDMQWWQQGADWAAEAGVETTWIEQYFQDEMTYSGTHELLNNRNFILNMMWDTEYVIYAYSFDENGNVKNQVCKEFFTTPSPGTSTNTFTCEVHQTWTDGVDFTITPSNDDPYFVSIEQYDRFVSHYGPGKEFTYEDMLLNILTDDSPESIAAHTFTGTTRINTKQSGSIYPIKSPDKLYNIIVVGLENGPTTDFNFFPFNSVNSEE